MSDLISSIPTRKRQNKSVTSERAEDNPSSWGIEIGSKFMAIFCPLLLEKFKNLHRRKISHLNS